MCAWILSLLTLQMSLAKTMIVQSQIRRTRLQKSLDWAARKMEKRRSKLGLRRLWVRRGTKSFWLISRRRSREPFSLRASPWKFANSSKSVKWCRGHASEATLTWLKTWSWTCRFIREPAKKLSQHSKSSAKLPSKITQLLQRAWLSRGPIQRSMTQIRKKLSLNSNGRPTFMANSWYLYRKRTRQFLRVALHHQRNKLLGRKRKKRMIQRKSKSGQKI